jgi:uncharacterized protein YxeA
MQQEQAPNKAVIGVIVIVLLVAVAASVYYLRQQDSSSTSTGLVNETRSAENSATGGVSSSRYANGTYVATGMYQSPGGAEEIMVTVKLVNGVVDSTSAEAKAASGTSRQYQSQFISNYKDMVVGKRIDEVKLDRVAGSSLTSNGFNEALDEIKQDAKS